MTQSIEAISYEIAYGDRPMWASLAGRKIPDCVMYAIGETVATKLASLHYAMEIVLGMTSSEISGLRASLRKQRTPGDRFMPSEHWTPHTVRRWLTTVDTEHRRHLLAALPAWQAIVMWARWRPLTSEEWTEAVSLLHPRGVQRLIRDSLTEREQWALGLIDPWGFMVPSRVKNFGPKELGVICESEHS